VGDPHLPKGSVTQGRLPVDTLVIENRAGAATLAGELAGLGYARFGILAGPQNLVTARDRQRGFEQGLLRAELTPPVVVNGEFTRDGGYAAMSALLDGSHGLDCVFSVNDVMAMGAIAACRDRGLSLPSDLALAGFDDIATLRDVSPSLTTVRLPLTELGHQAMGLVMEPVGTSPRRRRVRGTVVVRESTPPRR
jgi:LacI family transcriptional regulator